MHHLPLIVAALAFAVTLLLAAAIALGGPRQMPAMASVADPFRSVDMSALPPLQRHAARDGSSLAYRRYPPGTGSRRGSVVLIHGSSARSDSMHPLASGLQQAGFEVFALDVRGHGGSGTKGRIGYIGQLEDDIADFVEQVKPARPRRLVGFSAGGGFVLRFAADERQGLFDAYLLMAPFLGQDASTYRPSSGGWVSVGLPRIIGVMALNAVGITAFNALPVTSFALRPEAQTQLTPTYSYALALNFRPRRLYREDMAKARQPLEVLVGQDDDQFIAERFADEFKAASRPVPVTIVPGVGHVGLTLSATGIQAAIGALGRLDGAAH